MWFDVGGFESQVADLGWHSQGKPCRYTGRGGLISPSPAKSLQGGAGTSAFGDYGYL